MTVLAAALMAGPSPTAAHPIVIGETRVSRGHLRHWRDIARRGGMDGDVLHQAVAGLVISHHWISGEAADQGVTVTAADVRAAYREQLEQSFPDRRDYRRFLRDSGQSSRDVRFRVRLDLLSERLREHVTRGAATPEEQQERLAAFVRGFRTKWRARTACRSPWVSEFDCGGLVFVPTALHPVVVGDKRISRGALRYWAGVMQQARSRPTRRTARKRAARLLVDARWLAAEAVEHGIVVTRADAAREVRLYRRQAFGSRGAFRRWLRAEGYTLGDIRFIVRNDLRRNALMARDQGLPDPDAFLTALRAKWRPRTACRPPWVTRLCGRG